VVPNVLRLTAVRSVRPKAARNVPKILMVLKAPPAEPVDAVLVHLPFVFSLILDLKMRPQPIHCRQPLPEQPLG